MTGPWVELMTKPTSDVAFLCRVMEAAVAAGATTINIPDTVGYTHPAEYRTRKWYAIALPMLGSSLGYLVLNRADVLILGMIAEMEEVGHFSAAKRIVMIGTFALGSLNVIAGPILAAAYHTRSYERFKNTITRIRLLSCVVGLPCFVLMFIWPQLFLSLFSVYDATAAKVVQVLAIGQMVNVATGPVGVAMAMASMERIQAVLCGVTSLASIIALPLAVRSWGIIGAAYTVAGAVAFQNLMMLVLLHAMFREDHLHPPESGIDVLLS